MATQKLFYDNAFLTHFDAAVLETAEIDGRPSVALDRTAFYPTGGGQPNDLGSLNGVPVVDVRSADGAIWHLLAEPLATKAVEGQVDWPRRWDHMQNHSGQHILSQAFILAAGALTVAWHLSANTLTIDLDRAALTDEQVAEAERLANQVVQENRPISARIVSEEELPGLALRKQPDVDGPLRIVEIADYDRVACSGTHVSSTAQVGLVKVLRAERRGPETRIHFACGQRAVADYSRKHQLVRTLAGRFTRSEDELLEAVDKLQADAQANYKALKAAQAALVEAEAGKLWATAERQLSPRCIAATYQGWDADQVKQLALAVRRFPGCFVALAVDAGDTAQLFFARSEDITADCGQILRSVLAEVGGRGGGRPDYAQGSTPGWDAAEAALKRARELVVSV